MHKYFQILDWSVSLLSTLNPHFFLTLQLKTSTGIYFGANCFMGEYTCLTDFYMEMSQGGSYLRPAQSLLSGRSISYIHTQILALRYESVIKNLFSYFSTKTYCMVWVYSKELPQSKQNCWIRKYWVFTILHQNFSLS